MNSRERLLTTLQHKEPDHIPIDLDSMAASSIAAIAYNKLKIHLGVKGGKTQIWDPIQLLAAPEAEILSRFRIDTRPARKPIPGLDLTEQVWKEWTLPDGSTGYLPGNFNPVKNEMGDYELIDEAGQVTHRLPAGGYYFDQINYPLEYATTVAEIEAYPLPDYSPEELTWMEQGARRLYETTDKGIVCRSGGSIFEAACSLRGWERFLMDLALEPKMAQAVVEKLTNHYLKNLPGYLQAVGEYSQVIVIHDDLGSQNATFMSPKMYRKMLKPYHTQIVQAIKKQSNLFVFLHSDGNIRKLIPDLIEVGIDILNPVQISAKDMVPEELKRDFGKDLVFWGAGADTQHVLPFTSPEEVQQHVRELIDIFAPGGGYVFNQIHNIQANVPPENIVAMFDTAHEHGAY
jgi:uroporphyrinogen decarboxylase